ncbi:MAG TPA: VOC family protein [Terriglobales bacterium]|nr:VOC family protein [Terriglobales bacterium]
MTASSKDSRSTVIPGLRYRNAPAMIEWLCRVFGFEKQLVVPGPEGVVLHSQLTFGNGMIMIGSVASGTAASNLLKQPDEVGGAETQASYLLVTDIEAIYARAQAAGARMLIELEDKGFGGKGFCCADPEGHIWHVGTFDPWAPHPA